MLDLTEKENSQSRLNLYVTRITVNKYTIREPACYVCLIVVLHAKFGETNIDL